MQHIDARARAAAGSDVPKLTTREAAEAVRDACLQAALDGYERAGFGGLCEEGRWEMVVDAIKSLDVDAVLANLPASTPATNPSPMEPAAPRGDVPQD